MNTAELHLKANFSVQPSGATAVVYAWKRLRLFAVARTLLSFLTRAFKGAWTPQGPATRPSPPALYYAPHDRRWLVGILRRHSIRFEIRSWRSVSVPFLRRCIPNCMLGEAALRGIFWLEERFPHMLGKVGTYP